MTQNYDKSSDNFYPMSLEELRETLNEYAEMEISYKNIIYSLTIHLVKKEPLEYSIGWYRCMEPYTIPFIEYGNYDDREYRKGLVERMLNAPMFDDGKSLKEAIEDVSVDWFD
jgi:hypothetical protein